MAAALPEEPATMFWIGQHESHRQADIAPGELLAHAQNAGYDLLTCPVTNSHFKTRVLAKVQEYIESSSKAPTPSDLPLPLISPFTPEDTALAPEDSNSAILAVTSPWIDLGSSDPLIAHVSRQVFNQEVAYAAFCGCNNVIVPGPQSNTGTMQFSRAVSEALGAGPYLSLHVLLPMYGERETDTDCDDHLAELARPQYAGEEQEADEEIDDRYSSWDTWNEIRTFCDYHARLSIALEVPRQLPHEPLQSRWHSESIRLLVLPRTCFLRNQKGYPVLSKPQQALLSRFIRLRFPPWILLSDVGPIPDPNAPAGTTTSEPTPAESASKSREQPADPIPHLRYLRHLQDNQPPRSILERFGQGYQDYLQSPLQPLTDNLESITYEVFEKDPIKYEWYERAVAAALKDLNTKLTNDQQNREILVAVVGSGRGPLVTRVLKASLSTGIKVRCWAVEKNPNAHVLLQNRNATDPLWNKQVSVVKTDMRAWAGPSVNNRVQKLDMIVSELLGSFADNELSPECLDGVQHVLHPRHGISIPQSYSAHLSPIAAPRIHADLVSRAMPEKWEIPYVVMLHQTDYLCLASDTPDETEPGVKEAWAFAHPAADAELEQAKARAGGGAEAGGAGGAVGGDGSNEHNSRACKVRFSCQYRGVCHGLAGWFETVLYQGVDGGRVELSTNPVTMERKSKDMISWFPIFFPLKTPLYVPDNAAMEVSMWRQTDDRKVWYEWIVQVYEETASGRRRKLGMSELHSSRKNGCLM